MTRWITLVIRRSAAQKFAYKDLGHKSAFTPITRSPAQGPACKDLGRNGQTRAIKTKATSPPLRP
ncbi:hypothetical protein BVG98_08380 [Lacticaseibacillus rhamnosus]|nr:hypothetical protein BVG98_08380 [Lacticaseibacillus rhamnosus]